MAISSGTYTVGGVSADYPNLSSAFTDIATPLTGALTLQVIADHSSSAAASLSNLDLAGYTFTITSDVGPEGDAAGGRVISMVADVNACALTSLRDTVGGGTVVVEKLNIRANTTDYDARAIYVSTSSTIGLSMTVVIRDCVVDLRQTTASHTNSAIEILAQPNVPGRVHSCNVFNCKVAGHYSQSGSACFELRGQYYGYVVCENCVAQPESGVAAATGFLLPAGAPNVTIRNCVSTGGGATFGDFSGISQADGYNNMSEDATAANGNWNTGSGNISSITPADEYVSVDPDDGQNWFEPKSTGQAKDGGVATTISSNTYGAITTIARPHDTTQYSIGANEYPSSPTITAHPALERVDENDPANFSVTANDATGYQWQQAPFPGVGGTYVFSNMSGETASTLTIPSAGSALHQYQYRCVVSNGAGSVTSNAAYLLINGLPDPGSGGTAPARPTASITSIDHETREIVVAVSGTATVFRAELFDMDANVVAANQIAAPGNITIIAPSRGINYSLIVIAGDGSVPVNWSQPGMASAVVIRPLEEEAQPESGVGVTSVPSSPVQAAGPMGAGLAFPFRFGEATGAPETNSGIDHVVDGMTQILLTRINGRFIRRDFGSPVAGKLFAPDVQITQDTAAAIQGALSDFEHRAEVTNIVFSRNRIQGTLSADIKFRTFRTHQDGNLVYPFNASGSG